MESVDYSSHALLSGDIIALEQMLSPLATVNNEEAIKEVMHDSVIGNPTIHAESIIPEMRSTIQTDVPSQGSV